MNEVKGL